MATVAATEFKAKCLELMDRVAEGRDTYVITKHGRPVAKLVAADLPRKESVFGCMADQMEIVGDIEEPLWTEQQWNEFERERTRQWKATSRAGRSRGSRRTGR
jgi:prevent-host-death family protein